jgi:hypothetical protein
MNEIRGKLPNTQGTYHGFVWLYLRQPAQPAAAGG